MARPIAGKLYIKKDGEVLPAVGDWTYTLGGEEREAQMDVAGNVLGYNISEFKAPMIKGQGVVLEGFSIAKLQNTVDASLTLELENGKLIALSGAFLKTPVEASAKDGTFDMEFEAELGEEIDN